MWESDLEAEPTLPLYGKALYARYAHALGDYLDPGELTDVALKDALGAAHRAAGREADRQRTSAFVTRGR